MSILDYEGFVDNKDEEFDGEKSDAIDPYWEKQQKSTFTAWCNSHLRKVGTNIEAIEEDFRDGLKLMKLLEVISGETLPKPDRGKMKLHKIANINKCLKFIVEKGVHLVSIAAEEIVDGNIKMTLGMIWTIILRFAIQDIQIEDMSAKEGLLLWCQRKTAPYKNVRVNNFHMSFQDGLAFCALIHRHRPDLLNYAELTKDNPRHNLQLAFDVAAQYLDVPQMLNVEDMVNTVKPDEYSVMAYVSSYYHAFSGAHKAETASNRICKVINVNRENEGMVDYYNNVASDLLQWINEKLDYMKDRKNCSSSEEVAQLCDDFRKKYRQDEKPPRLEEKSKLESDYNTLQTRLRLSNRPAFVPRDGAYLSEINKLWYELENEEKVYEDWLMSEMKRRERLDHLVKNFHLRCKTHEAWTVGKVEMLRSEDYRNFNVADLRAYLKKQEAFESDFAGHSHRVEKIGEIAQELRRLDYQDMASIDGRLDPINETWSLMAELERRQKTEIQGLLSVLEEVDNLYLEYAKQVAPFYNWLEQSKEDLQDSHMFHHIEEVKILITELNKFNESMMEAEKQYEELKVIDCKIKTLAQENSLPQIGDNPYTILTQEMVEKEWSELSDLLPLRNQFLNTELEKQLKNEELREKFVQLANKLGPWIEELFAVINSMWSGESQLSLEDQCARLVNLEEELNNGKALAMEVDECSQELHRNMIFDTSKTKYTMETLRVSWEQLQSALRRLKSETDNQILTRDSRGISKSQMDEFVRCFNHFDKNRSRTLEPNEFRACLVSLGCNLKEEKKTRTKLGRRASMGEADFLRIMSQVDPTGLGVVTFEAFIDFMAKETTEQDTLEQIVQSFRTLAQDKEYITEDELRRELPADQAEYCISQMVPYEGVEGGLDYLQFASALYGQSDL